MKKPVYLLLLRFLRSSSEMNEGRDYATDVETFIITHEPTTGVFIYRVPEDTRPMAVREPASTEPFLSAVDVS